MPTKPPTLHNRHQRTDASATFSRPRGMPMQVGGWQVDPALDTLSLGDRNIKLEPRTMRLLSLLAERPGELLTTEELLAGVWPGLVVTANSLHQGIAALRRVLHGDRETSEFIATIPRKGYRLVAPVRNSSPADARIPPRLGPRSVAVLPFALHGLPTALDFLGDSLLDELIAELSRQPLLVAIARGTMLTYGGRRMDPTTLAGELGVRFVVDGRIECSGPVLRISAQLVDATTGVQVWADAVELSAGDWATLGRLVIGRLARALNLEVGEGSGRDRVSTDDRREAAAQTAMRAWAELYCRPQTMATNERAMQWAREALSADDRLAVAWNALAYGEWRAVQYGWPCADAPADLNRALASTQRALALAPRDPDSHYTLALVTYLRHEMLRAEGALRHCIELSPSYAPAHGLLGLVRATLGFPQETAAHVARAFALSPREPLRAIWHWVEASAALQLDDAVAALAHSQRGMAANADYPTCYVSGAVAAQRLGQHAFARECVRVLRTSIFSSIEAVMAHLPTAAQPVSGARLLADLEAAGLPRAAQ